MAHLTKKDLLAGKKYWAKKKSAAKFQFVLKIGGESPFLTIDRCDLVEANGNGTTPYESAKIGDFEDSFVDTNYPSMF